MHALGIVVGALWVANALLGHEIKTLNRLHAGYIEGCLLGTDEPDGECEARWLKALNQNP